MKKFLLPLAFCLCMAAASSCLKESTFSVTNYQDFATSYQQTLVTDEGVTLHVVQNQTGSEAWKQEGSRFYILCDIQNREMEIVLKQLLNVEILSPKELSQMENEFTDPLTVKDTGVGGGYFNLFYSYYYNPSSNYAHRIEAWWETVGSEIHLYLFHDGNGEDPSVMNEDLLKEKEGVMSVPLAEILKTGEYNRLTVTLYELSSDNKEVEKNTYTVYNL